MQVDPIKPMLKAPGTNLLTLKDDERLSNFAFKFILCRYNKEVCRARDAAVAEAAAAAAATAKLQDEMEKGAAAAAAKAVAAAAAHVKEKKTMSEEMETAAAAHEQERRRWEAGAYTRPLFGST